jgi:hypothetical protein
MDSLIATIELILYVSLDLKVLTLSYCYHSVTLSVYLDLKVVLVSCGFGYWYHSIYDLSAYWLQSNALSSAIVIIWLMLSAYIGLNIICDFIWNWLMLSVYRGLTVVLVSCGFGYWYHSIDVISVYWPQSNVLDSAIVIIWLMLSVYSGLTVILVSCGIDY